MSPASALQPDERQVAVDLLALLLKKVALGVVRSEDFTKEFYSLKDELQKDTEGDIDRIARFAAELSLDQLLELGILEDPGRVESPEIKRVLAAALRKASERMAQADDTEPEEVDHS